jgi:hypothetical protein
MSPATAVAQVNGDVLIHGPHAVWHTPACGHKQIINSTAHLHAHGQLQLAKYPQLSLKPNQRAHACSEDHMLTNTLGDADAIAFKYKKRKSQEGR